MGRLSEISTKERQDVFEITEYRGRVSFGQHSTLQLGEFRDALNWDLYDKYMKSRRGSRFNRPSSSPSKWASTDAPGTVTWDVGAEEYLIAQVGTSFYFQALLTPGNPTVIQTFAAAAFTVGSSVAADMFIHGNRLFIIHPTGNKVVEWNGTTFRGRALGMAYPYIDTIEELQGQRSGGRHVYAIEKAYQVNGADFLVSSPNRKKVNGEIAIGGIPAILGKAKISLQAAELTGDSLWTHLRLWRSKGLDADTTEPAFPIEPQGTEDELYEVALITRAEWERGSTLAVATGSTLPAGNANVTAGGGFIIDNNPDEILFDFIGLDRIELVPLPASTVGAFHAQRIWAVSDDSNDIVWSNNKGTKYSELYDVLNTKDTGDDGQSIIALFSFERDLVVLKEGKTGRIAMGNPDLPFEVLDQRIGVALRRHAAHLAGVGIVALTNDDNNFMIFGADLRWTSQLGDIDISTPIRDELGALTAANIRFLYINGKILLSEGNGYVHALHVGYNRGWTRYLYLINTGRPLNFFSFAGGQRAGVMSGGAYTLEIEVDALDTDDNMVDDTLANTMPLEFVPHMYQSNDGAQIIEQEWYFVNAKLSAPLRAIPFMNGLPWPSQSAEAETPFIVTPYTFIQGQFQDRQYRLFLEPQALGSFLWSRFVGNFLHYRLETEAPAIFKKQGMRVVVDEDDSGFLAFDPYQNSVLSPVAPSWTLPSLLELAFDETSGDIARDASGNNRHHTWAAGSGGTHAYDATLVPEGGQSVVAGGAASGYGADSWLVAAGIGQAAGLNAAPVSFRWVKTFPSLAARQALQQDVTGETWWKALVNTDGSLEFQVSTSSLSYKFTTAAGIIVAGTQYTIQFVWDDEGQQGQWYAAARTGVPAMLTTTRAALVPSTSWTEINASVAWASDERISPTFCTFGNKMWAMGGKTNAGAVFNDVWSSPDGITWTQVTAAAAWAGRWGAAMCAHAGKMYLSGGIDVGSSVLSDVWSSADGITWTQETANLGGVRRFHRMESFLGKIWLIGGNDAGSQPRNDIWSSVAGATWTLEKANAPVVLPAVYTNHFSPRISFGLVSFGGFLWVLGGSDFGEIYGNMRDLYKSADGINWTTVLAPGAGPWTARNSMVLLSAGGKMSHYGGDSGTYRNDSWESTPDGATWTQISVEGTNFEARPPAAWSLNDVVYIGPGHGSIQYDNLFVRTTAPSGGSRILPGSTGKVSHVSIIPRAQTLAEAEQYHNAMKVRT